MDIELRTLTRERLPALLEADARGFGEGVMGPEHEGWAALELDRLIAACDGDEIVGTGRCYSLEVTVPGGARVPAGGVSWIAVVPTHRRRGILTQMIARLHEQAGERREPVTLLTASEGAIYGRFGYGVATHVLGIRLDRRDVRFRSPSPPDHRVRFVRAGEATATYTHLFEEVRGRPGVVSRPGPWWESEHADPRAGTRFDVVVDGPDGPAGFAVYQRSRGASEEAFSEVLVVRDLIASTDAAESALWQYLCGVDLVRTIVSTRVPPDTALPWLLVDPRAMQVTSWRDFLWARILNVPRTLSTRTYACDGSLVLDVGDAGRFALDGGPAGARCEPTSVSPDLTMGVAELGSVWLGGTRPSVLASAGRIGGRPEALARADAMFAADRDPAALTWF